MDKIAQRRGRLNKLRETLNAPGEAVSGMFSPQFTQLMERLREVDDEAREHAIDLKDILKVAKSNFNRREYMTAITFLGRFHEKIDLIKKTFSNLIRETDMIHNEFLFGDLDPEHKKYLGDMPERFKPKPKTPAPTGKADDGVVKQADIKDWWHNLTSDRGKALKSWEKRFPKKAKEVRRSTEKMLSRSEAFMNYTLATFKSLATMRATRGLEEYLKTSQSYIQKYEAFDAAFAEYFNTNVRSFVESQKEFERLKAEQKAKQEATGETPKEESGPVGEAPKGDAGAPGTTTTPAGVEPEPTDEILKGLMQGNPPGGDPRDPGHFPPRPFPSPPGGPPDTIRDNTRPTAEEPLPFPGLDTLDKLDQVHGPLSQMPGPVVNDMTLAPTMLSQRELTPASPPPAMPSMPSVHVPPAARVPTIEETMMPSEKMHMYQPPAVTTPTRHEGLRPHNTMLGVAPPPSAPQTARNPSSGPVTQRSPAPHVPAQTLAYKPLSSLTQEFITNLTKLSGENPLVMATEIIKFAKSIEQTDKNTSDRLLVVARSLLK